MHPDHPIKPPFFEFGPKAYIYGPMLLELAGHAAAASEKYNIPVIITPQHTDIYPLATNYPSLYICAQHMDDLVPGRGLGSILPEAVKSAGAQCVMLNHAEKPLPPLVLSRTLQRADEVGLISIVCADRLDDAIAAARLSPDIIIAEPTELIGTGKRSNLKYITDTTCAIKKINPDICVLQGAGIHSPKDVYDVIFAGADATGCTSAITTASHPAQMLTEMICAVREAWEARKYLEKGENI